MELTTAKTIGILSVIFGCFAVLYPKIFHPMLMHSLSNSQPVHQDPRGEHSMGAHPTAGRPTPPHMHAGQNMRPSPHPGMRAAAEMKKQAAATQAGGGKGMMSFVLPLYAVGIVLYLLYTMTKVFGKKNKKSDDDYLAGHFSDVRYDSQKQRFRSRRARDDTDDDNDDLNDVQRTQRRAKQSQRELERLLLKADRNSISELEVGELKRRLIETEQQMSRLLAAMSAVSENVESTAQQLNTQHHTDLYKKEEVDEKEAEESKDKKTVGERVTKDDLGQRDNGQGHGDDLREPAEDDEEGLVSDAQGRDADKGHIEDVQGHIMEGHEGDVQGRFNCLVNGDDQLSEDDSELDGTQDSESDSVDSDLGSEDSDGGIEEVLRDSCVDDEPHDLRQRKLRSDPH